MMAAVAGCRPTLTTSQSSSGAGTVDLPKDVVDAYEAIAGRPFPDDVEVLGYEYISRALDDRVTIVTETTAQRADELAALEQDDEPDDNEEKFSFGVTNDRMDAALERRPIQHYQSQVAEGSSNTIIMGDDDIVTVVLDAYQT